MATTQKPNAESTTPSARIKKILARLEKVHPDAKLALDFTNPLELLIALILAAQARDDLVNKITVDVFKRGRLRQRAAGTAGKADRQDQLLS
jgi:endonuclease III